jgi:hypothetical protein
MCTTITATINDTTVTLNASDVLPQVLRMTDMKRNRMVRTCPTQLDKYAFYDDARGAINSPLASFSEAMNVDEVPNGAFGGIVYTNPNGQPLYNPSQGATPQIYTSAGGVGAQNVTWNPENGVPCMPPGTYAQNETFQLFFALTSTEKLVLSPFVFSDVHEWDTGLFGCQNIQLVMNLQAPTRIVRTTSELEVGGNLGYLTVVPGSTQFNSVSGSPFSNSRVNLQFLTPSLDVPLPPKSVVPYMEFPRYISNNFGTLGAGRSETYSSQTITLPSIPDLLMIWARPAGAAGGLPYANVGGLPDPTQGDWMLPISQISINFDNFAGLLSSHTQQQLYKMSVHNGLEMDWAQWSGIAQSTPISGIATSSLQFGKICSVGSLLVLKPGRDIALQAGQAPGLVGNFVLQFNMRVQNNTLNDVSPQFVVVTANSGFFETIKGSSRIIKGVLTEQDIISAPMAPGGTTSALRRAVGAGVMSSLGNAMSHVKGMYEAAKPYATTAKECVGALAKHTGSKAAKAVHSAMGAVGMGRSLKDRLM